MGGAGRSRPQPMSEAVASPTFKDNNGVEWDLTLSVGTIEDIRDSASVDLDDMLKRPEKLAELLTEHPQKLVQVLWVICEEQAKVRGVEPRAFGKLFKRDVIDRAVNSLFAAFLLFYPRGSAGRVLVERLPEVLARMDQAIRERTERAIPAILSSIATGSPASLESTPDPIPSVSSNDLPTAGDNSSTTLPSTT